MQRLLQPAVAERIDTLDVFPEIGSTSTYLAEAAAPGAGRLRVAIAGRQTAGRGRNDRVWISAAGLGLYLSVAASLRDEFARHPGLSLALGAAVADALEGLGIPGIGLKWPNDVILAGGKLGGVLTEARRDGRFRTRLVAGIGINVVAPVLEQGDSALRPIGLAEIQAKPPALELLAAAVVNEVALLLTGTASDLAGRLDAWRARDWLERRVVSVETGGTTLTGTARGIDDSGALLVATDAGTRRIISGTVRPLQGCGIAG